MDVRRPPIKSGTSPSALSPPQVSVNVTSTDTPDADLVRAALAGSRDAAGALVTRHLRSCHLTALAVTGDVAAAEDACQEAMVRAIERLDECRSPDRFGAWVRQIARNQALNEVRRIRRFHHEEVNEQAVLSTEPSPSVHAERADMRDRILVAMQELSEARREVVLLHDVEGCTHREIAARMRLPEGTVRSHVTLARRRLRELLSDFRPGGMR